jgi:hypothetical protein
MGCQIFSGSSIEKGKPVEKQGRKVSDLRGKPMIAGPPRVDSGSPLFARKKGRHVTSKACRKNTLLIFSL